MGSIGSSGTASWRPCEARAKGYSWASFSSVRAGTPWFLHDMALDCVEKIALVPQAGKESVASHAGFACLPGPVPDRLPRPPADPHAGGRRLGRCLVHGDGAGGGIFVVGA